MDARVQVHGKKVMKVLGTTCIAVGVVALGAVVASGAAVGTVAGGFKTAKDTMNKILKKEESTAVDEVPTESGQKTEKTAEEL